MSGVSGARLLRRFHLNRKGGIAVVTACGFAALLGSTALTVDIGTFYLEKRRQQAATDIAAMVAADHLARGSQAAEAALADNGFPASRPTLDYGTYTPDPALMPDQRFRVAPQASANAVRVKVKGTAPLYFGSALIALAGGNSAAAGVPIQTQAVAAQADFAAFAIGSRLASLNGGLLNQLLGATLGTTVSLSVLDYNALTAAQIDVFQFSRAVAAQTGVSAVTYGQLAAGSVHTGDALAAVRDAVGAGGGSAAATAALAQLAKSKAGSRDATSLAQLFDFGPFDTLMIGSGQPMASRLSALDFIMAMAELAGSGHAISLDLSAAFPGFVSLQLTLQVGDRPAQSPYTKVGRIGATVGTAQTRLLLTAHLKAAAPLLTLSLPIYLELASATASLSGLTCGPGPGTPSAVLQVLPSLADTWIGSVTAADFGRFGASAPVAGAPVATVAGLAAIYGRAHVAFTNATPTPMPFSTADIASETKHSSSTRDPTASLASSLVANLKLTVGPTGSVAPPAAVAQAITQSLTAAAPLLDPVLDTLLATLGLRIGEADTWITGVKCGGGVLVN